MVYEHTLFVLGAYIIVLLAIGVFVSRKISTVESFFLANRNVGRIALIATLTGTVVGGSATIATGKLIYLNGLPGLWLDIGGGLGLITFGVFLAKTVRKTGLVTLPEITGKLFDTRVRYAAAILIFLTQIAWVSLLIQGAQLVLQVLLPWNVQWMLIGITIVFIAYTFLGGQIAVVYTDIIQFLIMIIGVCCLAAPLLFIQALPQFTTIAAAQLQFPSNPHVGFVYIAALFSLGFMPHLIGPDIYSKILSAKDEKTARWGAIFSGVLKLVFAIAIGLISLAALALHPGLEEAEAGLAIPLTVLSLPPVLAGIILAAFLSVMLSSADSVLVSAGTVLSVDITKKNSILVSRIGIISVGFGALILALAFNDIIKTLMFAYTIFTGGLILPILLGFYKEKTGITSQSALWGLMLGGGTGLVWLLFENPFGIDAVLVGMMISIIPYLIQKIFFVTTLQRKKN